MTVTAAADAERATWPDWASNEQRDTSMVVRFSRPVLVLSTSREQGGMRRDVRASINYQICEPGGCPTCEVCLDELDAHLAEHAASLDCPPDRTVTMMTAASPQNAGWAHREHQAVQVWAVVTAGVSTNASRAGDAASHYEAAQGWEPVGTPPPAGTINLTLVVSHPMTEGGLTKASIMATEAKAATLQALRVRSMSGHGLATGTGTDQLVLACPQDGPYVLSEAQAHTRLGQMIAEVVDDALRQALARQNGLTVGTRNSVRALLMRFGGEVDAGSRDRDPQAVAAAIALASVFDHLDWGILPAPASNGVVARYAAELAACLSGPRPASAYEREIASALDAQTLATPQDVIARVLELSRS